MQGEIRSLRDQVRAIEEAAIREALGRTGGVKARAARALGITERMIGYKIRKYRIGTEEVGASHTDGGQEQGRAHQASNTEHGR